jgi:hypothetical protein
VNYILIPEVLASIVTGFAIVISSVIAAFSAWVISNRFKKRNTLEAKFFTALSDIEFLLAVEKGYCKDDKSVKDHARAEVMKEGLKWSGRFTMSRILAERERLDFNQYIKTNSDQ